MTDESGFGLGVAVFFITFRGPAARGAAHPRTRHWTTRRISCEGRASNLILPDFLANYHPAGLASLSSVATVTRLSVPLRRMDASLLSRMDTTLA